MKDKDLVYLVALDVRAWAEKYQKTSPGRYWEGLGGLCAIASAKLKYDLESVGVPSTFVANNSHCFLIVEDHIVDITATQFQRGFSKITIVSKENPIVKEQHFWKQIHQGKTFEEIQVIMKKNGWPEHQQPFPPGKEPT